MNTRPSTIEERVTELQEQADEIDQKIVEWATEYSDDDNQITFGPDSKRKRDELLREYEEWYNAGRVLISEYLSSRTKEFDTRRDDVLDIILFEDDTWQYNYEVIVKMSNALQAQNAIVGSIPIKLEMERLRVTKEVSRKITSDEIERAKELLSEGHIRAAGVVSGVALERHLLTRCEMIDEELEYGYMDGIGALAHTLSDAGEISDDDLRLLEYLGGVRNKCAHADEADPQESEVDRLISEAGQFIRGYSPI